MRETKRAGDRAHRWGRAGITPGRFPRAGSGIPRSRGRDRRGLPSAARIDQGLPEGATHDRAHHGAKLVAGQTRLGVIVDLDGVGVNSLGTIEKVAVIGLPVAAQVESQNGVDRPEHSRRL